MALYEYWVDVTNGSPNDTIDRYRYDTSTDLPVHDTFSVLHGTRGVVHPPAGTVIHQECVGPDFIVYKGLGNSSTLSKTTTVNDPSCCTLVITDFNIVKQNNTSLITPNGNIVVTAPVLDITDYQASIDGGTTWVSAISGSITFSGLIAGSYSVVIKEISGVCSVTGGVVIADNISYPPLIVSEETKPAMFSPVFYPIELTYSLDNNDATVKSDGNAYLEVASADAKDYLATLPIIQIFDDVYGGKYQVTSVDVPGTPTKFYISSLTYVSDRVIIFVPFERQVFFLYAETSFNVYSKIASISKYPDALGIYHLRLEGFLQGIFEVKQPINIGQEITLLRKYYVIPRDFDLSAPQTIFNAVYSAVPDLTYFLGPLIPLGPAPINFINEQTLKGLPVLFSYIDTDEDSPTFGRVVNVTSSQQTNIVEAGPIVYIPGLAGNQYDLTWTNPSGAIGSLNFTPALPAWITLLASPGDQVKLHIDLSQGYNADYDPDDYDVDDYLTGGINTIVGCYTFIVKDGATVLFTLTICAFPIQTSNAECIDDDSYNIAWINQEGGWSSYIFNGKKEIGRDIGTVNTYKKGDELRVGSLEDVYDSVQVSISDKSVKDLLFIASLRTSTQAYLYSNLTLQWSIPIKMDGKPFSIYKTPFKQIDVNDKLSFKYAKELRIQTQ